MEPFAPAHREPRVHAVTLRQRTTQRTRPLKATLYERRIFSPSLLRNDCCMKQPVSPDNDNALKLDTSEIVVAAGPGNQGTCGLRPARRMPCSASPQAPRASQVQILFSRTLHGSSLIGLSTHDVKREHRTRAQPQLDLGSSPLTQDCRSTDRAVPPSRRSLDNGSLSARRARMARWPHEEQVDRRAMSRARLGSLYAVIASLTEATRALSSIYSPVLYVVSPQTIIPKVNPHLGSAALCECELGDLATISREDGT